MVLKLNKNALHSVVYYSKEANSNTSPENLLSEKALGTEFTSDPQSF
jgi:hypothetical protein